MSECTCDARFSGLDDQEWLNRGAPSCTCTLTTDEIKIATTGTGDLIYHKGDPDSRLKFSEGKSMILVAGDPGKQPRWIGINWPKVWEDHDKRREKKIHLSDQLLIQELVEAQLKGE